MRVWLPVLFIILFITASCDNDDWQDPKKTCQDITQDVCRAVGECTKEIFEQTGHRITEEKCNVYMKDYKICEISSAAELEDVRACGDWLLSKSCTDVSAIISQKVASPAVCRDFINKFRGRN